jgi:hypothetical protein
MILVIKTFNSRIVHQIEAKNWYLNSAAAKMQIISKDTHDSGDHFIRVEECFIHICCRFMIE